MNLKNFKKRIYGKWILCGEHSVLRGYSAIAFPLKAYCMDVEYITSSSPFKVEVKGSLKKDLERGLKSFLDFSFQKIQKKEVTGELIFTNEIPFGAGLGASAVLCLGVAWFFCHKKWITEDKVRDFAHELEDFFHTKSSGIDVTVCFEEKPVLYQNGKVQKIISPSFSPLCFLSDSGIRTSTAKNIHQVEKEFEKNLKVNQERDLIMAQAVQLSLEALESEDSKEGIKKLSFAFALAESCFSSWNLISPEFENYTQGIKKMGALGVKPTGSGGGFALSFWQEAPPKQQIHWISLHL